jgi:exodeoxyribonuclease V alpha subunit
VLCAITECDQGLHSINRNIENYLSDEGFISLNTDFYINRPIIITSNNYALGLFNGDVGIIREDENKIPKAWFEDSNGNLKAIFPGLITQFETVFAMTIHKSQGSEFNQVLIVLPQTENIAILTRELLYTAVTRANSKVFIQSTETVILQTAEGQVQRASGIAQRFLTN